ncbi:MAG: radical SAM protein [Kouleothrix sp.]
MFLPRYQHGSVQGLFLSTGVDSGAPAATSALLDGVEYLRTHHQYAGYVHLKLLPGTPLGEVERAALADRLSLNLEAPSHERLQQISPERDWAGDLITRLVWARDWQRAGLIKSGLAAQFVVGAAGESDRELLPNHGLAVSRARAAARVLARSARPPTRRWPSRHPPFVREQQLKEGRLAAARHYGFGTSELPRRASRRRPTRFAHRRLAWALAHPGTFPRSRLGRPTDELLRVPGLGPISIKRIERLRRIGRFREPAQLSRPGRRRHPRAGPRHAEPRRFFGRDLARARHYARAADRRAADPMVEPRAPQPLQLSWRLALALAGLAAALCCAAALARFPLLAIYARPIQNLAKLTSASG